MKSSTLSFLLFLVPFISICQSRDFHGEFVEDFSDSTFQYFRYGSTGNKSDFKYQIGAGSSIEPETKILSFKIDPQDSAGAGRGPEIISKSFTHFGTYAARLKVPDPRDV